MQKTSYILFFILCIGNLTISTYAQNQSNPYPDYQEDVFMDMDFEQNLFTPEVPANLQNAVSDYMVKIAKSIKIPHTSVDIMRESDVIAITMPSDELFLPNDTLLDANAEKFLPKLLPLFKDPFMYKVVLSVHSDDTGSNEYLATLTELRQNSIYEWLLNKIDEGKISENLVIIPFAMGNSDYLMDNDTRENRRENRRVEFYLIPGPKLFDLARNNKLK